jgi:3-methyladenine DNA glycosylase AlkD
VIDKLKRDLKSLANPAKAKFFPRFFKAGPGEYAEGDKFIGATVPNCRIVAKKYKDLSLSDIEKLIASPIHEERLVALLILVDQYRKGKEKEKPEIYNFYLNHTKYINNWDLVDLSCSRIVGEYLYNNPHYTTTKRGEKFKSVAILYHLAKSKSLWERRISIISTAQFIWHGKFNETLKISKILLSDKHDLIHKAVGWMLREVGKRKVQLLEKFLKDNYVNIPRTTLRYAIERFPEKKRLAYLQGKV